MVKSDNLLRGQKSLTSFFGAAKSSKTGEAVAPKKRQSSSPKSLKSGLKKQALSSASAKSKNGANKQAKSAAKKQADDAPPQHKENVETDEEAVVAEAAKPMDTDEKLPVKKRSATEDGSSSKRKRIIDDDDSDDDDVKVGDFEGEEESSEKSQEFREGVEKRVVSMERSMALEEPAALEMAVQNEAVVEKEPPIIRDYLTPELIGIMATYLPMQSKYVQIEKRFIGGPDVWNLASALEGAACYKEFYTAAAVEIHRMNPRFSRMVLERAYDKLPGKHSSCDLYGGYDDSPDRRDELYKEVGDTVRGWMRANPGWSDRIAVANLSDAPTFLAASESGSSGILR